VFDEAERNQVAFLKDKLEITDDQYRAIESYVQQMKSYPPPPGANQADYIQQRGLSDMLAGAGVPLEQFSSGQTPMSGLLGLAMGTIQKFAGGGGGGGGGEGGDPNSGGAPSSGGMGGLSALLGSSQGQAILGKLMGGGSGGGGGGGEGNPEGGQSSGSGSSSALVGVLGSVLGGGQKKSSFLSKFF